MKGIIRQRKQRKKQKTKKDKKEIRYTKRVIVRKKWKSQIMKLMIRQIKTEKDKY